MIDMNQIQTGGPQVPPQQPVQPTAQPAPYQDVGGGQNIIPPQPPMQPAQPQAGQNLALVVSRSSSSTGRITLLIT